MCTLAVAFQHVSGTPLVVAANRDERLSRPAEPPRRWAREQFLAPRDLAAGGTWLGLTSGGLFVGITNRFGVPKDDARRSRGELVVESLRAPDARALHASLAALPPQRFNAFHLLYADRHAAFVTWSDGEHIAQQALAPGVHVITERSLGASDAGRSDWILARWRALPTDAPDVDALEEMMRRHDEENPIAGTCIHVPAFDYGTRSSMILTLGDRVADSRMRWAEGPPCTTRYVDIPLDGL